MRGGDGTVRLWDTNAVGPIGEIMNDMKCKPTKSATSKKKNPVVQTYSTPTPFVNVCQRQTNGKEGRSSIGLLHGPCWIYSCMVCSNGSMWVLLCFRRI